ncbi:hypothetical protein [Bacillus sp. KH172YL63]|uniref:hypothetical protein n=1 Tax=Bacillus sp. KH172YL63 TaxID=2709784 RepID=UPI0013E41926|nr:hypothetical protein [Bacillus sp. KH172YL63]BCB05921.1 spore coat protein B [Bacillus sp. KH172YL63]
MNKELMTALLGKVVRVNRGGPESRTGMVLYAGEDHFALLTEKEGVVYFHGAHVKSITHNAKTGLPFKAVGKNNEFMKEDTFAGLVASLQYKWVTINRGGPEKIEGVLDNFTDDYLSLVVNEEVVRIAMFHVKSLSYVDHDQKDEEKKDEAQEESNSNEGSDEQSSKKSSGKKSKKRQPSSCYYDEIEGAEAGY